MERHENEEYLLIAMDNDSDDVLGCCADLKINLRQKMFLVMMI